RGADRSACRVSRSGPFRLGRSRRTVCRSLCHRRVPPGPAVSRHVNELVMNTTVSVFGLGYVGCVSAACFAKQGHDVVGVDVSVAKVNMLNEGKSTILEVGIGELVAEMVGSGRLRATTDVGDAVRSSEV